MQEAEECGPAWTLRPGHLPPTALQAAAAQRKRGAQHCCLLPPPWWGGPALGPGGAWDLKSHRRLLHCACTPPSLGSCGQDPGP